MRSNSNEGRWCILHYVLLVVISALIAPASIWAQTTKTISGTVTDAKGEPLIGASLVVAGTTQGFLTDLDGNYVLENVSFPAKR